MPVLAKTTDPIAIANRFWSKVDKSGECWTWMRSTHRGGYGSFTVFRDGSFKKVRAPRMAYELTHGTIDPSLVICHKCDNPRCVRPDHLLLGTQDDNLKDMSAKGRGRKAVQ